jgi:hypothetical protein
MLARRLRAVELVKGIGSGGGITGWVVRRDWPLLWSGIIAASQFLDATRHVFPFARLHHAASELTVAWRWNCCASTPRWNGKQAPNVLVWRRYAA